MISANREVTVHSVIERSSAPPTEVVGFTSAEHAW
jgi:hypothetical protein